MKCLFVHVPKFANEYLPLGEFMNITYMPMGLFALAEKANRHGYASEIVHLGVEWMHDRSYNIVDEIVDRKIPAVGMPIHWHYQIYDTLQVAAAIRQRSPETFIFLGGYTASYFAPEIIERFPAIDAIVTGDGEQPLLKLLAELEKQQPDLNNVPNLFFRNGDRAVRSPLTHVATEDDLNDLVFADLPLLRHYRTYIESFGFPLAYSKEYDRKQNQERQKMGRSFFPLCTGRGCPVVCTYCAGNRDTLKKINCGHRVLWRDQDKVLKDIRMAIDHGYSTMSLCFDPTPAKDDYYVDLFAKIKKEKLPVGKAQFSK